MTEELKKELVKAVLDEQNKIIAWWHHDKAYDLTKVIDSLKEYTVLSLISDVSLGAFVSWTISFIAYLLYLWTR